MLIHGDPVDTHSPYGIYRDLVDDSRRYGIPLTLSMKRNSGRYYNVVLVGEEAFEFFKMQTGNTAGGRRQRPTERKVLSRRRLSRGGA